MLFELLNEAGFWQDLYEAMGNVKCVTVLFGRR